jgi:diketogulonate reductase-like aldo/keto reductase
MFMLMVMLTLLQLVVDCASAETSLTITSSSSSGSSGGGGGSTVEIAPGVAMPFANLGGSDGAQSNYTFGLAAGFRGFDTALSYTTGNVQPKLGAAIRHSSIARSDLFVTTKIPCCPAASKGFQHYYCDGHPRSGSNLTATADADINSTLADIGIDYADLILLHWPCETVEATWATYKALEGALADGRARAVGISNFNASAIDALLSGTSVKPAFNQCGFSVGNHGSKESPAGKDDVTRARCSALNITYGAYSPLNHGKAMKDEVVVQIAQAHNVSSAVVALRWLVQAGHTFTTASMSEQYDVEDLSALDMVLTPEEMARLNAL